jgi:hypothetical protein
MQKTDFQRKHSLKGGQRSFLKTKLQTLRLWSMFFEEIRTVPEWPKYRKLKRTAPKEITRLSF